MATDGRPRRRWGRIVLLTLGLGVLLLVGLVLLALPFRGVQDDAESARDDLEVAADALRAGDVDAAAVRVESARGHVDRARGATDGIGGDVWQWVPVAGGGVRDVRHLVEALDDATSIAEIGVEVYPQVLGEDANLVQGENVDMATLETVLAAAERARTHASDARAALDQVGGAAPMIGASVAAARDAALAELTPLSEQLDNAQPLLDVLPGLLGGEGERAYLVAVLNPSELRYSGGATLALATARIEDGQVSFRDIGNLDRAPATSRQLYWKKVPGNPFHRRGKTRIQNATWSPYWSTSGEELLRAWAKATKQEFDGMIAIDVPAIASLFEVTGPVQVEGVGRLDQSNVTQTLVGSYDTYSDIAERRALNDAVITIFREKLFEGGQFVDKFQSLGRSAAGRHFAVYLRDPDAQAVVTDLGVSGDLSDTEHDYLGVFTQNTNIAKVDYWQQRAVSSEVTLRRDGSADVHLTVQITNASPPYAQVGRDPRTGYFTRWSTSAVAVFLPKKVSVQGARVRGKPFQPLMRQAGDRPYFYKEMTFPPGTAGSLEVDYRVKNAATIGNDGELTYRLDLDPQGLVTAESAAVTVTLPDGFKATSLPPGFTRDGSRTVRLAPAPADELARWKLVASRR